MIDLIHGDGIAALSQYDDNYFDWAIVDPNYGRGEDGGTRRSGWVKQKNGSKIYVKDGEYKDKNWDAKPVDDSYFDELFRVSRNQVVFGVNYYGRSFGPGRLIWDKVNDGSDQSDAEIAYVSSIDRVDLFRYMWRGMMQGKSIKEGHIMQGNKKLNEKRIHPTQKPSILYGFILEKYTKPGDLIIDTHLGSMNIAKACHAMDRSLIGYEIDDDYYAAGVNNYRNYVGNKLF
jgi:site-specific DNA-methyltransferase (adenine-specific)